MRTVNEFVDQLMADRPGAFVPYVDPDCGGSDARILLLFQDPGPKAARPHGSGMLSISNNDASAGTLCSIIESAGIPWTELLPWNAVPWYTGGANTSADKSDGLATLPRLVQLHPRLQVAVTFGGLAAQSWTRALRFSDSLAGIVHISTAHPSPRGLSRGSRQDPEIGRKQILDDLVKAMKSLR